MYRISLQTMLLDQLPSTEIEYEKRRTPYPGLSCHNTRFEAVRAKLGATEPRIPYDPRSAFPAGWCCDIAPANRSLASTTSWFPNRPPTGPYQALILLPQHGSERRQGPGNLPLEIPGREFGSAVLLGQPWSEGGSFPAARRQKDTQMLVYHASVVRRG